MFSLLHAFLLFVCVVLLVRLMMPAQYALLNPYAATLDNLLNRLLQALRPAFPMPAKPLCGLLLVLALCADAVMLSRMGQNAMPVSAFMVYTFSSATFAQWLIIALLGLFRHLLMILTGVLVLRIWHCSRHLPGYSGDLLRLAIYPVGRFPISVQWLVLIAGTLSLGAVMMFCANPEVQYPMEALKQIPGFWAEVAASTTLSTWVPGMRLLAMAGLMVLEILSELHGFVVNLIIFSIINTIARNQSLAYFINDLFRLLRGPLPELRMGFFYLTPLLLLLILTVAGGILPAIFMALMEGIVALGGFYVV
jgi:hypothetical protein